MGVLGVGGDGTPTSTTPNTNTTPSTTTTTGITNTTRPGLNLPSAGDRPQLNPETLAYLPGVS